jgi:hypothetical protein
MHKQMLFYCERPECTGLSGASPVSFPADDSLIGAPLLKSLVHSNGLSLWRAYSDDHLLNEIGVYDNTITPVGIRVQRYHSYTDKMSLTAINDNVTASENQSFWLTVAGRLQNASGKISG